MRDLGLVFEGSGCAPMASLGDSGVNSDVTPCVPIVTLEVDNSPARLCLLCEASSSQDILLYVLGIRRKHP